MDETNKEILQDERDIQNNRACKLAYDGEYDEAIKLIYRIAEINFEILRYHHARLPDER